MEHMSTWSTRRALQVIEILHEFGKVMHYLARLIYPNQPYSMFLQHVERHFWAGQSRDITYVLHHCYFLCCGR